MDTFPNFAIFLEKTQQIGKQTLSITNLTELIRLEDPLGRWRKHKAVQTWRPGKIFFIWLILSRYASSKVSSKSFAMTLTAMLLALWQQFSLRTQSLTLPT